MLTAADWKAYDAAERAAMGSGALRQLVHDAEPIALAPGGAVVVPHTRLEITGDQIARAAATVVASGADRVLAIGVLHGLARDRHDRRGVHTEDGLARDEFSLDAFVEVLGVAAPDVDVVRRYPFLAGDAPGSLPGIDELERLVADGAFVLATTDPVHHGHAYGTAPADCLDAADPATAPVVEAMVAAQLAALSSHRFADVAVLCDRHRSDFRDSGPVLAHLLGAGFGWHVHDLALVDYSAALGAPPPSWVAGALIGCG